MKKILLGCLSIMLLLPVISHAEKVYYDGQFINLTKSQASKVQAELARQQGKGTHERMNNRRQLQQYKGCTPSYRPGMVKC